MMNIALLDIGNRWKVNWSAAADDDLNRARTTTIKHVRQYARDYDTLIVCADHPRNYRKELAPKYFVREVHDGEERIVDVLGYKAKRPERSDQEVEQMRMCLDELRKEFHVVQAEGYEGDDVIAYLAQVWGDEHDVTIISDDKDLRQCLTSPRIAQRKLRTNQDGSVALITGADVAAEFVPPPLVPHALALMGDTSDNIRGLHLVGPGKARWLLTEVLGPPREWAEPDAITELFRIAHEETARLGGQKAIRAALLEEGAQERIERNLLLTTLPLDLGLFHGAERCSDWAPLSLDTDALLRPFKPPAPEQPLDTYTQPYGPAPIEAEPVPPTPRSVETPPAPPSAPRPSGRQLTLRRPISEGIQPTGFDDAVRFASAVAQARMFAFQSEPQALTIILTGAEMGIGAMTALRCFHLLDIRGVKRVAMTAQLMMALCLRRSDLCEYFTIIEHDNEHCVLETKRVGAPAPVRDSFSIQDAQRAGLMGKDNWKGYPKDMCFNRAAARLSRKVYPDIMANCYTADELHSGEHMIEAEFVA